MNEALAATACRRLLGAQVIAVEPIAAATSLRVHRVALQDGRRVILKLYFARAGSAEAERRALTCLAAHTDVLTPTILASGAVQDGRVEALVLDDLGPSNLGERVAAGYCSRHDALTAVGSLLARIHSLPLDCGPGNPSRLRPRVLAETLLSHCPSGLGVIAAEVVSRAKEAITQPRQQIWCHGDLHPANIIPVGQQFDAAALHVVDLEQAACSVPEYDVAQSLVTSDALDAAGQSALLSGYSLPLDYELITLMIRFHALRGWAYAATTERRDVDLWAQRLTLAFQLTDQPTCKETAQP